jgi:hypothetical protein
MVHNLYSSDHTDPAEFGIENKPFTVADKATLSDRLAVLPDYFFLTRRRSDINCRIPMEPMGLTLSTNVRSTS